MDIEQRIPVPEETRLAWKVKLVSGDKTKIAAQAGVANSEVSTAFQGLAKPSLILAINQYYGIL